MPGVLKAKTGPGVWVPVIGGGGDVYVGTTEPVGDYDLWFDTDAEAAQEQSYETARWNSAWGIVAMGAFKAGLASPIALTGTMQQLTEPIPITTLASRRYRIVFQSRAIAGVCGRRWCCQLHDLRRRRF